MTSRWDAANTLLIARGADGIEHPGGTLLEHLRRVQLILAEWGAVDDVRLAGLCHAAYGTDGFHPSLLDLSERAMLAEAIGVNAESLVYLYGSCDRAYVYPRLRESRVEFKDRFTNAVRTPDENSLRAFAEITAANELDVVRHNTAIAAKHGDGLLRLFEGAKAHLSAAAWSAWSARRTQA